MSEEVFCRKQSIERRLREIATTLHDMGVDIRGPLVDKEGFPRNDVDLYSVRALRGEYNRLQTDHDALMREIELRLPELLKQNEQKPKSLQ